TVDGVIVHTILQRLARIQRGDSRPRDGMAPGQRLTVSIQSGRNPVHVEWPVHVVLNILLARPNHLHRPIDMARDTRRNHDAIDLQPTPEAATNELIVEFDL